jgi:hypothetical protein
MSATTPYLSAPTLAALMTLDESAMRSTCTITRHVAGPPNADNSPSDGTDYVQSNIKCRFTQLRRAPSIEDLYMQRITEVSEAFIRVPVGTDVLTSDTITLDGNQYEIVGTNEDRTFTTSVKLAVRRLT